MHVGLKKVTTMLRSLTQLHTLKIYLEHPTAAVAAPKAPGKKKASMMTMLTCLTAFIEVLSTLINCAFLVHTTRRTASWFNKSKFPIVTHLPPPIRQFRPAIFFVTEAFNVVICAKSAYSNGQTPSRDIGLCSREPSSTSLQGVAREEKGRRRRRRVAGGN